MAGTEEKIRGKIFIAQKNAVGKLSFLGNNSPFQEAEGIVLKIVLQTGCSVCNYLPNDYFSHKHTCTVIHLYSKKLLHLCKRHFNTETGHKVTDSSVIFLRFISFSKLIPVTVAKYHR